jgi:Ca2+-binding RTX toxin-like protein
MPEMTAPLPCLRLLIPLAALVAVCIAPSAEAKLTGAARGPLLIVQGGKKPDRGRVACSGGFVKVNGKDPATGAITCSAISEVDVITGPGSDRIDLSGVGPSQGFGQKTLEGFGTGTGCAAQLASGNDRFAGGASCFNLALGGPGSDRLVGGGLRDDLAGGADGDRISGGDGRDILLGNGGNDRMLGGPGDDLLSANAGNDSLIGAAGADLLGGGAGDDTLIGGPGDDQLSGGAGKDRARGGPGNDKQDAPSGK